MAPDLSHVGRSAPARRWTPALALLLVLALLSGCGSSSSSSNRLASKSPTEIVAAAKKAAVGAASVHIAGSIVNEAKPISLDMEILAGKGGKGQITLEGFGIRLIQVGGAVYINASSAFYTHVAGSAAAQLLQGKWLKASVSSASFASLASLTNISKLIDSTLGSHGKLASAPTTTINGQKAVGVRDTSRGGTLYVAATGTPYPLEIVKSGPGGGKITFDRWNKSVTLTAPTGAININQLQGGG
jgi:virulence-associated protein VapD